MAVEALGLVAGLVILLVVDVGDAAAGARGVAMVILFVGLLVASFGGLAFALWRGRRWARAPAIVLQLLLVPIGSSMIGGLGWPGLVVMALGLVGAGLLLAPSSRAALG